MPKTLSVILRNELEKRQVDLLDIYHLKNKDIVRVKDKLTGKVYLYETKIAIRDMDKETISNIAEEIKNIIEKSK